MADILNETVVSKIIEVIDKYSLQRAQLLVDDAARMSFVTTKAKELGITADEIEKVFNSAYVYVAYISNYSRKDKTTDNKSKTKEVKK